MSAFDDLFSLAGKTAIVTGGTRGIGEMIATGFLAQGAKVHVTSRKEDACAAIVDKLSPLGAIEAAAFDLARPEGVNGYVAHLAERAPRVDILVNNAGAAWGAPFDEFPEDGWDRVMDLNVKSLFFLTQKLAPTLRATAAETGRARVINIGSID
ncbi:MAG: SDR family NAD(P)-dependent oxidoreductase, partial [Caulobacterales bacterium]|nr:SDR family NAD(P)-dependent oxidoreductase [Caulobacterales bacterium]